MDALIILTHIPNLSDAQALAEDLVGRRLAACVNMGAPSRSVYRWQGRLETAEEVPMIIKTSALRYAEVEAAIKAQHPYELPDIVAVPVTQGLPAYLAWLVDETTPPSP